MRFRKRAWSLLVRIQLEGKLSLSAKGMTTGSGSRSRWAFQWRRVITSACRGARDPAGPQEPLPFVDPLRLLFGLVHQKLEAARCVLVVHQLAVVASMKAARASTVKTFVRMFPVCGSFTGAAAMSFFRLCRTRIE